MAAGHGKHKGVAALHQPAPERAVVPIDLVARHPRGWHLGEGAFQHPLGELWFGGERDVRWDPGLLPPHWIVRPLLGEIQCAVQKGSPLRTGRGQEHAHLAVLDPSGRAAVLALHAG